ncbi:unnamed protein product [Paramecium octaurelia]|uniref:Uncharacterized protein n=1 Tax=Paramecium octaurelia TaxID=43137 RepID=A0A8S1W525_PAROT|nr:unnamed protein product [Paramecium octaurelia]
MEQFQELAKKQLSDDNRFIETPKLCNEQGTKWLIGYNHLITSDEDYEQFKNGINKDKAQYLLQQDIDTAKMVLENEYNEKYGENSFQQLNIGCQYLLLSILLNTGRILQYSKLIKECQSKNFYQALKFNERKHISDENQNNLLKIKFIEEQKLFQEHFDQYGNPKKEGLWKYEILQTNEKSLIYATELFNDRFVTLEQYAIFAMNTDLEFCNRKSPEWIKFLRDLEGKKYNFASYNEEKNLWFPVNVNDQDYQIIGYSHICQPKEVLAYKNGLTDGQVNYLFLADYDKNVLKLRRFFKSEYPNVDLDSLTSQAQLLLIDLSFRNWPLTSYRKSIELAIQNKIQEAICESHIYYRPDESVNSHYYSRQDEIFNLLNQISSTYVLKNNAQKNFFEDPKFNNIVGVKITENNFNFVLNEEAETKIQIQDLFTFLKVYYDPEFADYQIDMSFTLDPEENDQEMNSPFQQKIYFPKYLEGTHVGEVLYEADFLLKQMSLGIEVLQREPLQTRPFDYGNLDLQPLYKLDPEYFARIFLKIGKLKLHIIEDKNNHVHKLEIQNIQMAVDARTVNEELQDEEIQDENNGAYRFANQFGKIYDQIAQKYPILTRLKQVLMANYLAKYMFEKGISLDYKLIEEIFNKNLIQNYQPYKSPTLKLDVEDEQQIISIRGGIDGNTEDVNNQLKEEHKKLDENPTEQSVEIQSDKLEAKIERCDSVTSISTQDSEIEIQLEPTISCSKCKQNLESCEIKRGNKDNVCKSCQGKKCSKCQSFIDYPLQQIQNESYCKGCIKCHECNKFEPRKSVGSFLFHEDCLKVSQNSVLKKEMIAYIKKYFGTKQKKGDNNDQKIYFYSDPYPCLNIKDYSGYIIGYNHPLIKSQVKINQNTFRIPQEKADKYLIEDLDQFERELYNFYLRQNKKPDDVPENIRMLMLFVLFIFKDFNLVLNLANQQTFNHLFVEASQIQYKKQGTDILKGKVEKALDFFNDRFHRKDGSIREKDLKNQFKKMLPTQKRN